MDILTRRAFLNLFLRRAGCFAATACLPFRPFVQPAAAAVDEVIFPQGVASGDPHPEAVMLWVRAVPADGSDRNVSVTVQISKQPHFKSIVLEEAVDIGAESDHTLRFFVQGLEPDSVYYYRFTTEEQMFSPLGRTRTAPLGNALRPVRFGCVNCQNYELGFYGAWRRLVLEDEAAPPEEQIDFILHLGDFIYEDAGCPINDVDFYRVHGEARFMKDRQGHDRTALPLPSGGRKGKHGRAAQTLADYRQLYKVYLSDVNLQAARARWPFICIWDDHEFADNSWQSHTTETFNQTGRLAASRAWFEYIPSVLNGAYNGTDKVKPEAHDFRPVAVQDSPFGDPGEPAPHEEPNNLAAINSLTIYRSLRFGAHVEIILTDTRSYRSDHCLPEWWVQKYFQERTLWKTPGLIEILDAGSRYAEGSPPEEITNNGVTAPNPRRNREVGTMLGACQKRWWKEIVSGSDATWKFWANSVPALHITLDFDGIPFSNGPRIILNDDTWDGYPVERRELARFVSSRGIQNLVSLSGDMHCNLAGTIYSESIGGKGGPVCPEFVVAGISSTSLFRIARALTKGKKALAAAISDDAAPSVPLFNNSLRNGIFSTMIYRLTGSRWLAERARSENANPHLSYVDTNANGYGVVRADGKRCQVSLVTVEPPLQDLGDKPSPFLRKAHFTVRSGVPTPTLDAIEGTPPFPLQNSD